MAACKIADQSSLCNQSADNPIFWVSKYPSLEEQPEDSMDRAPNKKKSPHEAIIEGKRTQQTPPQPDV